MGLRLLKTRILISFIAVVGVLATMIALLGWFVIQRDIIERAEAAVLRDLQAARWLYADEIRRIGETLDCVAQWDRPVGLLKKTNLHYMQTVTAQEAMISSSEIVRTALTSKRGTGGTRILKDDELGQVNPTFTQPPHVEIKPTPRARPTQKTSLDSMIVKEYALPLVNTQGEVYEVIYGGRVMTLDLEFVDRIRDMVFGDELYAGKPIGTVTIFQEDVRVATNVLDETDKRAVGTRVSEEVYAQVIEKGRIWHDRAFVVTDWYMTAYEPIRDIRGQIVGILYVGLLEQPFQDMARKILWIFLMIVGGATLLAAVLSLILAVTVSKPLTEIVTATGRLSEGDLGYEVATRTDIEELNTLARAFNVMSIRLKERQESLHVSNEKLTVANKNYVDLIGFVAHELKGMLASAVMNTYSIRDGYLGMVNFKQQKAINSVARNLDYLTSVVQRFLNLGRIERGELIVHAAQVTLWQDVFKVSMNGLMTLADRKELQIEHSIDPDMVVTADPDLLLIVANNLLSNAIKYCPPKGRVTLAAHIEKDRVRVEVYNDSTPLTEEQRARLFRKFSRLETAETKREKGTGLGLFITKQIVEAHEGLIWVEPQAQGNSFIFEIPIRSKP